jgi:aryl-alcohol dehydrogenase-like predicted oxidoreductase
VRYLTTDFGPSKKISRIGLGTWQIGSPEWGYGEAYAGREAAAIIRRALDLGVTLFDTAELYGNGRSERVLGRALGQERESIFLATKVAPLAPSSALVRWRAAASARRLGVRSLDLYQVHWPSPLVSDRPLMRALRGLQQSGRIGEVGVSGYSLARWRAAEEVLGGRILANQVSYSLIDRGPEEDLLPFAESSHRLIIAHTPLAKGLLSGTYHLGNPPTNDVRITAPQFSAESLRRAASLMETLRQIAAAHAATPAQIALAWVIRRPAVVAIPGASSVEQLEANAAAADIDLSRSEYDALTAASERARLAGGPPPVPTLNSAALRHIIRSTRSFAVTTWNDLTTHVGPLCR